MLSGYSEPLVWNKLSLAPLWLRGKFLSLIEREKEHAKNGRPARIIAKMNSLCDPGIIEALYDASEAGVEIDLIVRGICCLRAGIKGLSEHIRVRSIVGTSHIIFGISIVLKVENAGMFQKGTNDGAHTDMFT